MTTTLPFDAPDGPLDGRQLQKLARLVAEHPELWEGELRQTTEERTYVEVFTNEHLGIWAISWMDEVHDTGYHDHHTSAGGVHVARGTIRHEHLRLGHRPVGQAVPAGEGYCFDETVIHRMRPEPGAGPTVTIHAYSPPLTRTGQYGEGSDELLHRVPAPAEEQLRPKGKQGTPSTR
ncbi:hypothetical protein [Crossiella sp. NPDC003009]